MVGSFATSDHPADRVVEDFVLGAQSAGASVRRLNAVVGKVFRGWSAPFLQKKKSSPPLVVPLMGPKWWILHAALGAGYDVIPYCWDVWEPDAPLWRRHLSNPQVRGVVCSSSDGAALLRAHLPGKPVEVVYEALSPSRFTSPVVSWDDRDIDVLELGRRDAAWHAAVTRSLVEANVRHLFEASAGQLVFKAPGQLDAAMSSTRLSVCFTRQRTHPDAAGAVEALTHRFLESMAAGCVLIGENPRDLVRLMGYAPVLEVDRADPVGQVLSLLKRPVLTEELRSRNRSAVMAVGTWETRGTELSDAVNRIQKTLGKFV